MLFVNKIDVAHQASIAAAGSSFPASFLTSNVLYLVFIKIDTPSIFRVSRNDWRRNS